MTLGGLIPTDCVGREIRGTNLCNLWWLAHTSCGIVLTIPTEWVDCYWWVVLWPMHSGFFGFGVVLLTMCLVVGGKQKKETKSQSVLERKLNVACLQRHACTVPKHIVLRVNEQSMQHHRHVCTVQKHRPFSMCNRTPSPIWLRCRCFQLPSRPTLERHLGGLECVSRTNPPGVGWSAPPRFVDCPGAKCVWHHGRHREPVSVTKVSRVCSVTMVTLVACTPLALVAIQPVTSVEWRRPRLVVLGHLVRLSRSTR